MFGIGSAGDDGVPRQQVCQYGRDDEDKYSRARSLYAN